MSSQQSMPDGVARSDSKLSAKALYEQRKKYSNSNVIMQETSQYHVEHLSTFVMDKSESIATVDDAIRKLALLDSKDKIWTQEVLLQVSDKAVRLLDVDTQEELENFPLSTIHHSQTVLRQTRYPSVLLIVCQDQDQLRPDIHFFHCDEVEAEMVHADIDSALGDNKHGKKMRPQTLKVNQEKIKHHRESIIPPTSASKGPAPGAKGRVAAMNMHERRDSTLQDPESYEKVAQRIQKDVQILNCALDDIEIFVARLQKAAEAFNQLRQRKSKKSKKRAPAEGMLTLRAKPPSEAEFVDSLQKLKLSFNLLAKLKKHIQNPSAAELVHFLFGPLELVIQSCGGPELARSVVSPHLSRDTVDFLKGHLTPTEMTVFEKLGDGWTRPRADWPRDHCAPPYFPKFRNGWEPSAELFKTSPWETEGSMTPPMSPNHSEKFSGTQSSNSSNGSYNGLASAPRKYAKIRYPFSARNANELSVLQDEVLEVMALQVLEDDKQWWKLRSRSGESGYVPFNILDVVQEPEGILSDPLYSQPAKTFRGPAHSSSSGQGESFEKSRPKDLRNQKMDSVNNELLMKITADKIHPPAPNFKVERPSSSAPLTFDSKPPQVTAWLKSKGFQQPTVECLGILTGAQLFSLNKEELKVVCGDEGSRVYSQITVQKAQLEKVKGDSELEMIMRRRQEKISGSED
ncbi:hypothetical protein UPYG_G00272710 [Umbra pygmaea]|uniref:SH3 domain-containing protein n=1 Tax=Umbra pygmaea TaxID=75934 RepID=A0ABD0WG32_UMBPY